MTFPLGGGRAIRCATGAWAAILGNSAATLHVSRRPQTEGTAVPPNTHLDHDTLRELQSVLGSDFPVLVRTYLADSETRLKFPSG